MPCLVVFPVPYVARDPPYEQTTSVAGAVSRYVVGVPRRRLKTTNAPLVHGAAASPPPVRCVDRADDGVVCCGRGLGGSHEGVAPAGREGGGGGGGAHRGPGERGGAGGDFFGLGAGRGGQGDAGGERATGALAPLNAPRHRLRLLEKKILIIIINMKNCDRRRADISLLSVHSAVWRSDRAGGGEGVSRGT